MECNRQNFRNLYDEITMFYRTKIVAIFFVIKSCKIHVIVCESYMFQSRFVDNLLNVSVYGKQLASGERKRTHEMMEIWTKEEQR